PGRHAIRFTIDNNQLYVDAGEVGAPGGDGGPVNRLAALMSPSAEMPMHLVKALPEGRPLADADLEWLVDNTKDIACGLFEEIIRQNQEVLSLLHELQGQQRHPAAGQEAPPHAA